jgi:WAS family protein 3
MHSGCLKKAETMTVFAVMLQDLHLRKPFKSSSLIDQHTLDRQTLPTAMNECYGACDRPPELDKLNPFRYRAYFSPFIRFI